MTDVRRVPVNVIRPHIHQRAVLRDPTRYRVVVTGRRFGKTALSIYEMKAHLAEGRRVWFTAPTYQQTKQAFRVLERDLRHIPHIDINRSELFVELPNGGRADFKSLHAPDNLRGAGLDFVIMDEAAFVADEVWGEVIRPMLLTGSDGKSQGRALFISSPNGMNWFHDIYVNGLDDTKPDWSSYHFTSYDNPLIDPAEIDAIRYDTPQHIFDQEYLAAFTEDSGTVFRNINGCIVDVVQGGEDVVIGVDLARDKDFTVFVALDRKTKHVLEIERFTDTMWTIQEERLKQFAAKWKSRHVIIERNFNSQFTENIYHAGIDMRSWNATNDNKAEVIHKLAMAVERGEVGLPRHEVLLNELRNYGLKRLPSGKFRYEARSGLHDDTVIALALAWHEATDYMDISDFQFYRV